MSFDDFMILNHEHLPFLHDIYHDDAWWLHYIQGRIFIQIFLNKDPSKRMISELLDPVFFVAFMPRHNRHPCRLWILQPVCHGSEFQIGSVVVAVVVVTFEKQKKCRKGWCWGSRYMVDMVVSTLLVCVFIDICIYIHIFLFCERLQRYSYMHI